MKLAPEKYTDNASMGQCTIIFLPPIINSQRFPILLCRKLMVYRFNSAEYLLRVCLSFITWSWYKEVLILKHQLSSNQYLWSWFNHDAFLDPLFNLILLSLLTVVFKVWLSSISFYTFFGIHLKTQHFGLPYTSTEILLTSYCTKVGVHVFQSLFNFHNF